MSEEQGGFRNLLGRTKQKGRTDSAATGPNQQPIQDEPAAEQPEEREDEAFSLLSSDRRQKLMLSLRFKTGNAQALAYSYLVRIDFNPSAGIVMDFSGWEVRIAGRNLGPLFAGLTAWRVSTIREMDELHAEAQLPPGATVVTKIEVQDAK